MAGLRMVSTLALKAVYNETLPGPTASSIPAASWAVPVRRDRAGAWGLLPAAVVAGDDGGLAGSTRTRSSPASNTGSAKTATSLGNFLGLSGVDGVRNVESDGIMTTWRVVINGGPGCGPQPCAGRDAKGNWA